MASPTRPLLTPPLVGTDSFSGALGRAAGENVNTYAYTLGSLSAGSNYSLSLGGSNTFAITPAPVTVTPNAGQSKVYGQADPVFTYTFSPSSPPFAPSFGTFSPATTSTGYSVSGALGRTAGENVNTYAYNLGTLSIGSNFTLSLGGSNTFAITPKPVTVTPVAGQSKIYGQTDPVFTYTFSPTPLVGSDAFSGALTRAAGANVGLYSINQGTLALSSNYTLTFTTGVKFTINIKPITVTANAQTKTMTFADPALTYTVVPALISGDSFTGGLTRAPGELPGYYNISLGTLDAGTNYSITFVGNRLEIRSVFTDVGPTTIAPNATTVPAVPTTTTTPPTSTTTTPPTSTTTPPTSTTTPPTTTTTAPPTTTTKPPTTTTTTPPTTTTTTPPTTTTTTPPTTTAASGSGTSTPVIVGTGGGVLVVLLGGLLFLFWRRRKKDDKDKKHNT